MTIHPRLLVDDVMRRWPATIPIFIRHHMDCIGCPVGILHTIEDACTAHDVSLRNLLPELQAVSDRAPGRSDGWPPLRPGEVSRDQPSSPQPMQTADGHRAPEAFDDRPQPNRPAPTR